MVVRADEVGEGTEEMVVNVLKRGFRVVVDQVKWKEGVCELFEKKKKKKKREGERERV